MFYYAGESIFLEPAHYPKLALVQSLTSACSFLSGSFLILLILLKTPDFLRILRIGLLNLTLGSTLYSLIYVFFTPFSLHFGQVRCIEIMGIVGSASIASALSNWIFIMNSFNIAVTFVFRYIQLAYAQIAHLLLSKRLWLVLYAVNLPILCASFAFVHVALVKMEDFALPREYEQPINEMNRRNNSFICTSFGSGNALIATVFFNGFFFVCTAVMIVFAVLTVVKLRSQKAFISKRTYELQRCLVIVVCSTSAIPFVFGALPLCAQILTYRFFPHALSIWVNLQVQTVLQNVLYLMLNVVYVVSIKPYREAVVGWVKKCKKWLAKCCCSGLSGC